MFPLECFHGNSHAENVGVARDEKGDIVGLKVDLMMDGKLRSGRVGRRVHVYCVVVVWGRGFMCIA